MRKLKTLRSKLDSPHIRILGGVRVIFLVALLFCTRPVLAQQYERGRWTAPPDLSGLDDSVLSMAFDKAGDIYVGGYFTNAGGDSNASHVAKWDGKKWNALGSGFD